MEIESTFIEGLKLIYLKKIDDSRGTFIKNFNADFFSKNQLDVDIKECYYSISSKNVIRGMHFQEQPFEHTKLVYVNTGKICDVVLDIRKQSKTFGKYFFTEISADKPVLVYIPVGCAHGFLSIQDNTVVSYMQTSVYNQIYDHGIRWNSFGMDWRVEKPIISSRDQSFIDLGNYNSPF